MVIRVATEESYRDHLKRLRVEIKEKTGETPERLYQERQKRLWDAIEMKQPDRVPVIFGWPDFAAKYGGLPYSAFYYDVIPWKMAYTRMMVDFEPDTCRNIATSSGAVLDVLEAKNILWPGGTLPSDVTQQAVDGEWLREDEYDLFIDDTADFVIRSYLPRVYGALAPLAKLPPIGERFTGLPALTPLFVSPEFQEVARALLEAGQQQTKYLQTMGKLNEDIASLGFPPLSEGGGAGGPAFDVMANRFRGWRGIVTDMYRRPEKLIAALEKINRGQIARATPADPKKKGPQLGGGGAIHRGSDRFLSRQQWETFYWPTWKKSLQASIDLGYTPLIFAEGSCENRLEYFLEFRKGSMVIRLDATDMFTAKEVLGNHFCLMGNVPQSLLQMGSPSEVDEYCKKLIKVAGKGGGYILRGATDAVQDARPENVRAMIDSVKKYGVY
ncbi:MAG: uroporphyrinogen decarboxylase family protein [Chloroflexota bacterium]